MDPFNKVTIGWSSQDIENILRRVTRKNGRYTVVGGRCAGRNPPSVLGSIQLYGLPAPPAGGTRRLFALSPCGSAVSPLPHGVLAPDRGSQHLPGEVSFLSGADALAPRLSASQPCSVDGVSSDPHGPGSRPPAHRPRGKREGGVYKATGSPRNPWHAPRSYPSCRGRRLCRCCSPSRYRTSTRSTSPHPCTT